MRGGWDVARRTIARPVALQPGHIDYTSQLPEGLPLDLFAACISVMPGTLSQQRDGSTLTLHVLDVEHPHQADLNALEQRILAMLPSIERRDSHA